MHLFFYFLFFLGKVSFEKSLFEPATGSVFAGVDVDHLKIISEHFEGTQPMIANKSCLGRAAKVLSPQEPNCLVIVLQQASS